VCILPFGILEKHGPHLPLGTDLLMCGMRRCTAVEAGIRRRLPDIILGKFSKPSTSRGPSRIAASCQLKLLQNADEMGAQCCKKFSSSTGNGGNESLIPYFGSRNLKSRMTMSCMP